MILLCRYLDGFSVFEVGSDGLIHCHRLHKVSRGGGGDVNCFCYLFNDVFPCVFCLLILSLLLELLLT